MATMQIIEGGKIIKETAKAVQLPLLACMRVGGGMTSFPVWLAKSQIKINDSGEVTVPAWLARRIENEYNAIMSV